MKKSYFLIILVLIALGVIFIPQAKYCTSMPYDELSAIVSRDLIVFDQTEIPTQVLTKLAENKVVVVGEHHFVKEHEEMLTKLATALNREYNFSKLLLEGPQAFSWIYEDYSLGIYEALDEEKFKKILSYFNVVLNEIRAYNLARSPEERLTVSTLDINNNADLFIISLEYMQNYIEESSLDELVKELSNCEDYSTYAFMVGNFRAHLNKDKDYYISVMGEKWYARLVEMVDVELYSIKCRNYLREGQEKKRCLEREAYIKKRVDEQLKTAIGGVLINVGGPHAQKTPLNYLKMEWVGQYLSSKSPYAQQKTYCLRVTPAKGLVEKKRGDLDITAFPRDNELHKVIAEYAGEKIGFLSFEDERFSSKDVIINESFYYINVVPPKQIYDGVMVLPWGTFKFN